MAKDDLIVYGANCVWWDSIDKAGSIQAGGVGNISIDPRGKVSLEIEELPCCPHCKGVLFQMPESEWNEGVANHTKTHPDYSDFIAWLRGKCFPSQDKAYQAFLGEKQGTPK